MQAASPRPSSLLWQILLVVGLGLALTGFILWLDARSENRRGSSRVTLRVESSSGHAVVTYRDGKESSGGVITVTTPWEYKNASPSGSQIYLTAGNPTQLGTLKCTILLDYRVWKQQEVTYPEDKVACAGIVP